jgi:hypothetical protein
MGSESPPSAFPFLRLPLEIRNCIYRVLLSRRLTSAHAYRYGNYRWPVKFAPAILRANKQVFEEASRVLYTENDFIVLRVATHTHNPARRFTLLDQFPSFTGLSENQIPLPVMQIAITELKSDPFDTQNPITQRTFIFTPEGLPDFIHLLWCLSLMCNFYSSLKLSLTLFNNVQSRHEFLNNHVVRSLDQLQGFGELTISGDVDGEVIRHLIECMVLGQQLEDVRSRIAEYFSLGELCFKKEDYKLARYYWVRLRSFWAYRSRFHSLLTRYSLKDFMEATLPIVLKADLGGVMTILHFQDHKHNGVVAYTAQRPLSMAENIINQYNLSYRVPPVLAAKFQICESLGLFLLGEKEEAKESHDTAVNSLCKDPRFFDKSLAVSRELEWARDSYLKQQEDPLGCGEDERDTSTSETNAILPGWRSLWEWLGLSE